MDTGHSALSIIGGYLGQLAATIALTLSPERMVFGGGVLTGGVLLSYIRSGAKDQLNGYLPRAVLRDELEDFITAPGLGERSGISEAILLAMMPPGPGAT